MTIKYFFYAPHSIFSVGGGGVCMCVWGEHNITAVPTYVPTSVHPVYLYVLYQK